MNPMTFTSELACDAIARRLIRERGRDHMEPFNVLSDSMMPLVKAINRHGKIPSHMLRQHIRELVAGLRQKENVVDLETRTITPAPSHHEEYMVTYIQSVNERAEHAKASERERWLDFTSVRLTLRRDFLEVYVSGTEFRVSDHVLSRYMQREQRPLKHFFEDIARPMRVALPIGGNVAFLENQDTALPFSSGILLGKTNVYDAQSAIPSLVCRIDRKGVQPLFVDPEATTLLKDYRVSFDMLTFIDGQSLGEGKDILHRKLVAFEDDNKQGLRRLYDLFVLGVDKTRRHLISEGNTASAKYVKEQDRLYHEGQASKKAIMEAYNIVQSPEWSAIQRGNPNV